MGIAFMVSCCSNLIASRQLGATALGNLRTSPFRESNNEELILRLRGGDTSDSGVESASKSLPFGEQAHSMRPEELIMAMRTSLEAGLSSSEAHRRLLQYGENKLKAPEKKKIWALILEQFEDKMVQILLGVATLSAILAATDVHSPNDIVHAFTEPVIILTILILNASVGVAQVQNADASLESLKQLQPETACVLRDGVWNGEFPAEKIVPGDVVYLRVGDRVPADCRVVKLKTITFNADEASLTGESVTASKSHEKLDSPHVALAERSNMVFSGTMVTNGGCYAIAVSTGQRTEIGAVNAGVQAAVQERGHVKTPLTQKLDNFSDDLTKVIGVICVLVFVISIPKFDSPAFSNRLQAAIFYAKTAVALGVAAIPEGLPAVITMCLSLGTTRMDKRNVIVRKLPSIETLGCTSVICTDKTGTLTTNQMTVKKLVTVGPDSSGSTSRKGGKGGDPEDSIPWDNDDEEDYDDEDDIFCDDYSEEMEGDDSISSSSNSGSIHECAVEGVSYDPEGPISSLGSYTTASTSTSHINPHMTAGNLRDIAAICSLCNEAAIEYKVEGEAGGKEKGVYIRMGEPTEAALKVLVEKLGMEGVSRTSDSQGKAHQYNDYWAQKYAKLCILEFNRDRKSMGVLVRDISKGNNGSSSGSSNRNRLLVKGAAELVVKRCNRVKLDSGAIVRLTGALRVEVEEKIRSMQMEPLRCLALAYKDGRELPGKMGSVKSSTDAEKLPELQPQDQGGLDYASIESDMVLCGITGIRDPARPEVKSAIHKCSVAGIRVMMMTGDSKDTAVAIARDTDIFGNYEDEHLESSVFTGEEFFALSLEERKRVLQAGNKVFCRTEPRDKQVLVTMLEAMGEVCAMTGDGVNDAPALQQADIGIAMGITGTKVAQNAADMVLADDNFATIVSAVDEGRNIYNNMLSFVTFLLSCNMGEVVTVVFGTLLGIPEVLSPMHLLWVNLVTDGPPATALGFTKSDPSAMSRHPRHRDEAIMSPWMFKRYIITGLYVGFATIGSFLWWYRDKHVTLHQLSDWTTCESWPDFTHSAEAPVLPLHPCDIFHVSKHKARAQTMALSTLVTMEMLKALSAVSLTKSMLHSPPWTNPILLAGVTVPFLLHLAVLYIPQIARLFGLAPLTKIEWKVVAKFALPILLVEEVLKYVTRHKAEIEERERREASIPSNL